MALMIGLKTVYSFMVMVTALTSGTALAKLVVCVTTHKERLVQFKKSLTYLSMGLILFGVSGLLGQYILSL